MVLSGNDNDKDLHRLKGEAVRRLARRQFADLDPAGVARDAGLDPAWVLGLVPDEESLLTALVLDAYSAMGESAERALDVSEGAGPLDRWVAVCDGVRAWALSHPEEYVLIWGRPVPGYSAPPETMAAGARTVMCLLAILHQAREAGELAGHETDPPLSAGMLRNVEALSAGLLGGLPLPVVARMLIVWTQLHGAVGFEVNGHIAGVAADPAAFFRHAAAAMGRYAGLTC